MPKALLIIGHGSKSQEAIATFNKTVDHVRQNAGYEIVSGAHMELAAPCIEESVDVMADNGINEIIMIPYFLYSGIHIKHDIPEIIEELKQKYPQINFKFGNPIGFEPVIADILIRRAKEAEALQERKPW